MSIEVALAGATAGGTNATLDKSGSGTITAMNGMVIATTNGMSSVVFTVTGPFVATYFFVGLNPDGSQTYLYANSLSFGADSDTQISSAYPGTYLVNCAGFPNVAVLAGAYTSGTITVGWNAGAGVKFVKVFNPNATNLQATVFDDYSSFEAQHVTLTASTDTTITFSGTMRLIRVTNYDTANRILVKNAAIASDSDSTSTYVGIAPIANVPSSEVFPFKSSTIHIRSAGASEVVVEGFS